MEGLKEKGTESGKRKTGTDRQFPLIDHLDYYGTLGPACCTEEILVELLEAGMTGIRLNLSHRSLRESRAWIHAYQQAAKKAGKQPQLLIDLMGPEIRIGELPKPLSLIEGNRITLGKDSEIPVKDEVVSHLFPGQKLELDDGKLLLQVEEKEEGVLFCTVRRGGLLSSRKSLAVPGVSIPSPALTKQDLENLKDAKEYGVTAVMQPFVRSPEDLITLKKALQDNGGEGIQIFAKIENLDGVKQLNALFPFCDQIVIARGDLGNAVSLPELPVIQQQITAACREADKPFMVVTQMLNSMMENPVPTRAEVNDIFHAAADGAVSVMLTGETAAGAYPVAAMKILVETGEAARHYLGKNQHKL